LKIFGISFGKSKPEPIQHTPPGPVGELQRDLTNDALEVAFQFGERLDFSNASIESVETVLRLVSNEFQKTKDSTGLNGIAFQFGAYIATTIQRNFREGTLLRDHPEFGDGTFPFEIRDSTIFPFAWCQKRIFDGAEDNVSTKYRILVLEKYGGEA
jgi:hypothetical protein